MPYYPSGRPHAYRSPHSQNGSSAGPRNRPNPNRVTPFPTHPPPCNRPRSICPEHDQHYRVMMQGLRRMEIQGLEELEYIYSRARGPDMWADMILDEFRACDVRRCVFEHFGVLPGPGLLPQEIATGTDGRIHGVGSYGGGRGGGRGGHGKRGGRIGQMVEDDRASVASWGNVSRNCTRSASSVRSTRSSVRSYGRSEGGQNRWEDG